VLNSSLKYSLTSFFYTIDAGIYLKHHFTI
jgi:hypothetical protein